MPVAEIRGAGRGIERVDIAGRASAQGEGTDAVRSHSRFDRRWDVRIVVMDHDAALTPRCGALCVVEPVIKLDRGGDFVGEPVAVVIE